MVARPAKRQTAARQEGIAHAAVQEVPRRRISAREALLAGTLFLLGLALRLWGIGSQSIWEDEAAAIKYAKIFGTLRLEHLTENLHGPLHAFLLHYWARLFGTSGVALRSLSLLASMACLLAFWLFVRRLLGSRTGLAALGFMAASPFHVWYAQEVRNYSLLILMAVAAEAAYQRLLLDARPSMGRVLAYAGAVLGGLLSNLAMIFLAPVHLLRALAPPQRRRTVLPGILLCWILAAVAMTPWISTFLRVHAPQRFGPRGKVPVEARVRLEPANAALSLPYVAYVFATGYSLGPSRRQMWIEGPREAMLHHAPAVGASALIFGALWALGIAELMRSRSFRRLSGRTGEGSESSDDSDMNGGSRVGATGRGREQAQASQLADKGEETVPPGAREWLLLSQVLPVLLLFLLSLTAIKVLNPRYAGVAYPAFVATLALGATRAPRRFGVPLAFLAVLLSLVSVARNVTEERYHKEDYRSAAAWLLESLGPGDAYAALAVDGPLVHYYMEAELNGRRQVEWTNLGRFGAAGYWRQRFFQVVEPGWEPGQRLFLVIARPWAVDPKGEMERLVRSFSVLEDEKVWTGIRVLVLRRLGDSGDARARMEGHGSQGRSPQLREETPGLTGTGPLSRVRKRNG